MFTQDLADAICERLAAGDSLRKACEAEGVKHPTFLLWVKESQPLADHYARMREAGRALRFEALNEKVSEAPERDDKGRIDPAWVAWKRLQVDTEKWTLAKQEPKLYGDKIEHEHKGGVTLTVQPLDEQI